MKKLGILVLLVHLSTLLADEYGGIAGKIIDKTTNHVLAGAQVIIKDTGITATADEHGAYIIPYVRAGTYALVTGTMLSFVPLSYINVIVVPSQTTFLDFDLDPSHIDFGQTRSAPISQDINVCRLNAQDIGRLPAVKLDELIRTTPGIVTSDYGLHLRGSTSDDITYYVDGLIFMWPYITGWKHIPLPLSAIEDISLQSGSIEAEYGETRTGIVNIVMRQAATRHAAKIYYSTDEIFPGDNLNFGYNHYDILLSGPLSQNLGYFFSGDLSFTDAFQQAKHQIPSPRNDYHGYGKLTYQLPNARGQLSLSGFRAREQWVRWNPYIEPGNTLKYFDQRPMTRTKYSYGMAALDYRLSSKNLTSLRIGIDHFDRCYGNRDYIWEEQNNHSWYDDYRFKAEHLIPYLLNEQWQEQNSISVRNILVDSMMTYHIENQNQGPLTMRDNPWGVSGLFYIYGDYRVWSYSQHNNVQARLDMNQYFNRYYTLKSGIHFIRYDNRYYSNPLAWYDAPLWDCYLWEPYRIDGYLQNNITYKNVSAKVGLRLDYFNPNSEPLIDTTPLIPDTTESEPSLKISPRLGINLLMWNRLNLGINYEHYLRVYHMYTPLWPMTYRTTVYGISGECNVVNNTSIGCNLYYRRHNDWMQIKNNEYEYNLHGDHEREDYVGVMGMQISLQSKLMKYLILNVAYNLQYAYGSNIYWWQGHYNYQAPQFPEVVPADFDERHQVRMELHLDLPPHRAFKLFKSFNSSLFLTLFSGQPYTPADLRGNQVDNKNAGKIPGYWNVDWKLARRFRIGRANLVLSALILNFFNTRQVIDVYNTTGDPDKHGDPLPSVDQFANTAISSIYYSPQADYNHDGLITPIEARDAYVSALTDLFLDPTNYGSPLRIQCGIGIEF